MTKYLKYILILVLFILPLKVSAIGTSKYYVDVTVNEDGSATFKEMIIFDGSYNYLKRNLYLKGNTKTFTGNYASDFYNTDIYNATSITNICASSTSRNVSDFSYVKNHDTCFDIVTNGYSGMHHKYELNANNNDYNIIVYHPSSYDKAFYLEYTITDAVVIHNDVAELMYNFEWSEVIEDYQVYLHLPKESHTFRIFSHGPMQGENKLIDNKTAYAYWEYLESDTKTDIRIVFDKSLVPQGTKKSNVSALDKIVEYETKQAEIQNDLREQLKEEIKNNAIYYTEYASKHPSRENYNNAIYYVDQLDDEELKKELQTTLNKVLEEVIRKEKIARNISLTLTILWILGLCYLTYKFYKKYDKEYKSLFTNEYLRELPASYGPEILGYLLTKSNIKSEYLSASIMELIRKKSLKIDDTYSNNKKFKIIDLKDEKVDENLTSSEKLLKKWFINEVGNGEYVTDSDIKRASKNDYEDFLSSYRSWKNEVISVGESMNFYEKNGGKKALYCLYALSGIAIYILCVAIYPNSVFPFILVPISIIAMIYILTSSKKTPKGNDDYVKWMAFKRFLLDFGRFEEKELPEIYLWEHFLVYATTFGIADKVEKAMNMKIQEYKLDTNSSYIPYFYTRNIMINNIINNSIQTGISKAQSAYNAAHSSSSSSGGFGGGASFGGGGGGFGGGGGRG